MERNIKILKIYTLCIIALLVIIAFMYARANFNLFGSVTKDYSKHYEYKIEYFHDLSVENDLNSLGATGWQVVGSRRATSSDIAGYEFILMKEK
jgi:hypothetical protein